MISGENILKDVAYLTETIGVRLAGTSKEKEAAEYLQKRFLEYVPECEIETFPMVCSDIDVDLQLRVGDVWLPLPAIRLNQSPVEEYLEAPLMVWDNHTDYQRQDLSCLTGKAVLHIGNISSEDRYRRLMEAKPAFLMAIDTRYPAEVPVANSLGSALWCRSLCQRILFNCVATDQAETRSSKAADAGRHLSRHFL